jgi:hypothetical protein
MTELRVSGIRNYDCDVFLCYQLDNTLKQYENLVYFMFNEI